MRCQLLFNSLLTIFKADSIYKQFRKIDFEVEQEYAWRALLYRLNSFDVLETGTRQIRDSLMAGPQKPAITASL